MKIKLSFVDLLNHRDQARADQMAWHKANGSLTAENTRTYRAGFDQGWAAALSTLQIHGGLKLADQSIEKPEVV